MCKGTLWCYLGEDGPGSGVAALGWKAVPDGHRGSGTPADGRGAA